MVDKTVCGVGINDADYIVDGAEGRCEFYRIWCSMIHRCYSKNRPRTYINCRVCVDWLRFSVFKRWVERQDWKGKELDKDILGDGTLYSPKTCCFVEHWLNSLFNDCRKVKGKYPTGVSLFKRTGRFISQITIDGKLKYLGYFDNVESALMAYVKAKQKYVVYKMNKYPNDVIRCAVLEKVNWN